jgi:hypothetical protein
MAILIWFADHAVLVWAAIVLVLSVIIWFRWAWITTPANLPVGSALGTIVALIVTSAFATLQPAMTRIALQNNLIYQMQKDTRTTGIDFNNNRATSGEVFAVMQSVYIQYQLGSINGYAWPVFLRDFCSVMHQENMRREWQAASKSYFSKDFIAFMDGIVKQGSTDCT